LPARSVAAAARAVGNVMTLVHLMASFVPGAILGVKNALCLCVYTRTIQFFIIYVPSQQPQGNNNNNNNNNNNSVLYYLCAESTATRPLTQHTADIHNCIKDSLNIESRINSRST
jgi:hypothetical protein